MSKSVDKQVILDALRARGLLDYGAVIERSVIHSLVGLVEIPPDMPWVAAKPIAEQNKLTEMNVMYWVRDKVLEEGKNLHQDGGIWRVDLPSENAAACERFQKKASRAINRANKLARNTPAGDYQAPDESAARMLLLAELNGRARFGTVDK